MKILFLRGLIASGKTTYAKNLVSKDPSYIRVNKDDIRAMIGAPWSKESEKLTLSIRDRVIENALTNKYNVIVDDTNFSPVHEQNIRQIAKVFNADFEIKEFNTPIWECLERDAKREKPVGAKVIQQMYHTYLAPHEHKKREDRVTKAYVSENKTILCDIDGSLAHMVNRGPYDYSKVIDDIADSVVSDIVRKYEKDGFHVIIVSGREDNCKEETLNWLASKQIPFHQLLMRKAGDKRPDNEVKMEIYKTAIEPFHDVFLVLDDREKVVRMWRSLGLKCLQVEPGNF